MSKDRLRRMRKRRWKPPIGEARIGDLVVFAEWHATPTYNGCDFMWGMLLEWEMRPSGRVGKVLVADRTGRFRMVRIPAKDIGLESQCRWEGRDYNVTTVQLPDDSGL